MRKHFCEAIELSNAAANLLAATANTRLVSPAEDMAKAMLGKAQQQLRGERILSKEVKLEDLVSALAGIGIDISPEPDARYLTFEVAPATMNCCYVIVMAHR